MGSMKVSLPLTYREVALGDIFTKKERSDATRHDVHGSCICGGRKLD